MKKTLIVCMVAVMILGSAGSGFAARQNDTNRQTWFNDMTDWFATAGKSERDKREILRERKNLRRVYREQKQKQKRREETQKRIKKQNEAIMKKINSRNQARWGNK